MGRVGSGQDVFDISLVGSGRVRRFEFSRVGSGQEVSVLTGRVGLGLPGSLVGSGRVGSGRVGSGRERRFSTLTGRVGSGHPRPTVPASCDTTRENPGGASHPACTSNNPVFVTFPLPMLVPLLRVPETLPPRLFPQ